MVLPRFARASREFVIFFRNKKYRQLLFSLVRLSNLITVAASRAEAKLIPCRLPLVASRAVTSKWVRPEEFVHDLRFFSRLHGLRWLGIAYIVAPR